MRKTIIRRITGGRWDALLSLLVTLGLLAVGYPQTLRQPPRNLQTTGPDVRRSSDSRQKLGRIEDPEGVALFLHVLERYARNAPDKTETDKRVAQALDRTPGSRELATRLLANYHSYPLAERRAALGQHADLTAETKITDAQYNRAFQRLIRAGQNRNLQVAEPPDATRPASPRLTPKHQKKELPDMSDTAAPGSRPPERKPVVPNTRKPMSQSIESPPAPAFLKYTSMPTFLKPAANPQGGPDRFTLWYEGIKCVSETDSDHLSSADEIYIITTVTDAAGNNFMTRHPRPHNPNWYTGFDDGETRRGPRRGCWGGADGQRAQNLTLTVAIFEQDSGDPADTEKAMGLMWTTAGAICAATAENAVWPCVVALVASLGINLVVDILTGGADDLIEIKTKNITADNLRTWSNRDPRQVGHIFYHFSTNHQANSGNAEGAEYNVYFRITSPIPFG